MLSFWEQDVFVKYDYIVVGSGIVGLSAAIEIAENKPKAKVLVLEKGIFPTGASTKNAGFACFGSITELLDDLNHLSEQAVLDLVKMRFEGLNILRNRLGDAAIDYRHYGGYELVSEKLLPCVAQLDKINQLLFPYFKDNVFALADEKIETFGFDTNFTKHLIYNQFEGQIHTGKMVQSLLHYAQKKGITILTGATVEDFEEQGSSVFVSLSNGIKFQTVKLAICTNAFTYKFKQHLQKPLDLSPGRGQVLITKPIEKLKFKGVFHIDEGYLYMRNYQDRVIFGGGRNIAFEEEATTEIAITDKITDYLIHYLDHILLPNTPYKIAHQWAGIMAFGENKQPILEQISERIVLGVRLGGMGVAIGSGLGKEIAKKILKE